MDELPRAPDTGTPAEPGPSLSPERQKYREQLLALMNESQGAFDKTIVTLSGGALGVSFAFVKNFVGDAAPQLPLLLFLAWSCWTLSLAGILASHYTSAAALRRAVEQLDGHRLEHEKPGGVAEKATELLNPAALVLFLAGLISAGVFVFINLGG